MNQNTILSSENLLTPDLILHLIKQDLKSNKLALSLESIGLRADDYFSDLGRTIMSLLGFDQSQRDEKLYKLYEDFLDKIVKMEPKVFHGSLNQLALELYNELVEEKKARGVTN